MSDGLAIRTDAQKDGQLSLVTFISEHGRLPFIDDEIKPWSYKGWLLPYRIGAEAHPEVASRYDYVARTLAAGKLPDEPLPQIYFHGEHDPEVKLGMKHLDEMMKIVGYRSNSWNAFRDVVEFLGYGLGVQDQASKLDEDLNEQLYRHFNLEHWLLKPTDYLGQYLCEMNHNKAGGFFPTPMHVCEMMVRMTYPRDTDCRAKTSHDPAVGTGRFLLSASNYSMRLFGQDIDGLVVMITKINLALFAPWHHIPKSFWEQYEPADKYVTPSAVPFVAPAAAIKPSTPRGEKPATTFDTSIEQLSLFDTLTVRGEDGNDHQ